MGTETRTEQLPGHDGIAICADIAGDGPPLVMVHGTSADRNRWQPVLPQLAAHFTCYALDRRGRGGSSDGSGYRIDDEFDDIAAVIAAVRDRHQAQVHMLGHSYGALCALHAARHSSHIDRLVLYEPPIPGDTPVVEADVLTRLRTLADAGDREGIMDTFARQVVRYPDAEYALIRSLPTWPNRLAAAHTIPRELGALSDGFAFAPTEFEDFRIPTLLLLGSESPPFLREATLMLRDLLPGVAFHEMEGQAHNAIDQIPDAFASLAVDFLARP